MDTKHEKFMQYAAGVLIVLEAILVAVILLAAAQIVGMFFGS